MTTLDELGKKLKLQQSSLNNNYLMTYENEIVSRWSGKCNIIVISDDVPLEMLSIFSERFPLSKVLVITYKKNINILNDSINNAKIIQFSSINELLEWSINLGSVDVIIEHSTNRKSHKLNLFKKLFLHLKENGLYFIEELHAKFITPLIDCEGDDILDFLNKISNLLISPKELKDLSDKTILGISEHVRKIAIIRKLAIVEKQGHTFKGLRSQSACDLIKAGSLPGTNVFYSNKINSFTSKCRSDGNIKKLLLSQHSPVFTVPPSYINKYEHACCTPGQIVYVGNYLLPDSFRMQYQKNLSNRHVRSLENHFYSLANPSATLDLDGDFFYLDSEYPSHFGHFTSEVVSRLWAWKQLKSDIGNLKVLLSVKKGAQLPSYARKILNSFGIVDEDIKVFDDVVRVRTLYTASPYYVIGGHVHPEIDKIWSAIREGVIGGESRIKGDRLFIARPVSGVRKCLNPERLEEKFLNAGFEFFSPENHSWEDQIKTFCQAKHIAGYSGSGLFNIMFCDNTKSLISMGADSYNSINDHLICSAKNIELDYIWSDSLIKHGKAWSLKAFMSDYNFNYERDEQYLDDALKNLT